MYGCLSAHCCKIPKFIPYDVIDSHFHSLLIRLFVEWIVMAVLAVLLEMIFWQWQLIIECDTD